MQLPVELLALVFAYLPARDLDVVKFVCREWRDVASDRIWRQRFEHQFGTTQITRVIPASRLWRREFLARQAVLQKWRRCVKNTDITSNSTLGDISSMFPNFNTDEARTICFNTHTGMGNLWDLDRGKMRRRLYASKYSHQVLPIASIDGSRFGLAYGFYNGEVATVSFTRDGTVVADYHDLPYRHDTATTALWVAKQRQLQKASKRPDEATVVASGSTDGTVYLYRPEGHRCFRPTENCVVALEGTMYGTYTKNDGSIVACLDIIGNLSLLAMASEPRHLAKLPFTLETAQIGVQLFMANDYVVVQTVEAIYVVDIHTSALATLRPPEGHRFWAVGIDKSYTPGTKYIAAGTSNNEISLWSLTPPPPPAPPARLDRDRSESPEPATPALRPEHEARERELQLAPIWSVANPIGFDHRLETAGKPQITRLALNAAVLLVGGYNGVVHAMDILNGLGLKRVSSRISKNVLDVMMYSRDGLVPVTHLEIDPNPLHFRAVIATRPALQYLDLGSLDTKSIRASSRAKASHARAKRGASHLSAVNRQDLSEEIAMRRELAELDADREESQRALRENFSLDSLAEDEQMEYALMLSEQAAETAAAADFVAADDSETLGGDDDEEDEELRRAIELSTMEEERRVQAAEPEQAQAADEGGGIDEDLRRALALSLEIQ